MGNLSPLSLRPCTSSGKVKRSAKSALKNYGYTSSAAVKDMLRKQGLPETLLDDAPFTVAGKCEVIGNGVPLPMGRAIARAVRKAIA